MTTRVAPPSITPAMPVVETPVIVPPGTPAPGRARSGFPLRREGPEKLTGLAKYADDRSEGRRAG